MSAPALLLRAAARRTRGNAAAALPGCRRVHRKTERRAWRREQEVTQC